MKMDLAYFRYGKGIQRLQWVAKLHLDTTIPTQYLYFNRNPLRQTLCTTILLIIVSCSVFWFGRPLRAIHSYVTARSKLLNHKIVPTDKIINQLKTLLEDKQKLIDSYAVIGPGLSAEEGDILKTDFESNLAKVDLELKKQ